MHKKSGQLILSYSIRAYGYVLVSALKGYQGAALPNFKIENNQI